VPLMQEIFLPHEKERSGAMLRMKVQCRFLKQKIKIDEPVKSHFSGIQS
jgi:hypothetical protein